MHISGRSLPSTTCDLRRVEHQLVFQRVAEGAIQLTQRAPGKRELTQQNPAGRQSQPDFIGFR
jgi:hypothetical protein